MAPSTHKTTQELVIELETKMQLIAESVDRLREANEGTLRTRGMKERITLAENDIRLNKEAWEKLEKRIEVFERVIAQNLRDAFTEVDKSVERKFQEISKKIDGVIADANTQKTALQKIQPVINAVSWIVVTAGGIILAQLLSGHWRIVIPP